MQRWQCAQHENLRREGGEQGEGEKRKREAEGSKGFTARSLAFQVMDTLVLV